jgi:23S rRNA (cytidine1920-2'-O)/16S rRNA (cytidine1409-2'-O)-methyltransferase
VARGTSVRQALIDAGLAQDRREADALVMAGRVMVGERKALKAGEPLPRDPGPLRILGGKGHGYVSRGGLKLAGALDTLRVDVAGLRCVDVGASTGGFVDCLLQRGAAGVVATDVGYGLLADKLRRDERVVVLERTHARSLQAGALPWPCDLLTADLSFIGLAALMPTLVGLVRPGGALLVMVKPQFEAAAHEVGEGGVVSDEAVRARVVAEVADAGQRAGATWRGQAEAGVAGPSGNREVFVWLRRGS